MMPTAPLAVALSLLSLSPIGAQETKLLPSDGEPFDLFGRSVAISGGTAIAGSHYDDDIGSASGSAYLFDAVTGQQLAKLLPDDGAGGDRFGVCVAIEGDTAVIGSSYDDDNGNDSGSAYVFDAVTGQQLAKLLASDGEWGDRFGFSVAISGDTVIVGANYDDVVFSPLGSDSGSAYLFDVNTSQQLAKLIPSDGAEQDWFGYSVAIRADIAIVGAWRDDDNGIDSGSAYLFDISDPAAPVEFAKLLPIDGEAGDFFGRSVSLGESVAVIGASGDDDNGSESGSAYIFDTATGQQIAKLLASDGAMDDGFGSVAISGDTAIVGAWGDDDNGSDSGSAYLFDVTTGQQLVKLFPSDGSQGDFFGSWVALDGDTALVGAYWSDDFGASSGSAYLFDLPSASWAFRGGILGLNPPDFTCSNTPALGATWNTQVKMTPSLGTTTLGTFVSPGLGGPTEGILVFGHELLILPPIPSFPGSGAHDIPVPSQPALLGLSQSWQGARLELGFGGTFFLVLTNALDVVYGL